MKPHHRAHLTNFTKFCIVNGVTFALDLATVRAGIMLGLSAFYVGIGSFIVQSVISYFLLHFWVFKDHTSLHSRATVLYALLVFAQALMVGYGISYLLSHTQMITEVARTLVGVFVAVFGYVMCHNFIFLPKKK